MATARKESSSLCREGLLQTLVKELQPGSCVYLGAFAGMGKTYVLQRLSERLPFEVLMLSTREANWLDKLKSALEEDVAAVFVDDVQEISDSLSCDELLRCIEYAGSSVRFVLAGRSDVPSFLKIAYISGRLTLFSTEDFRLGEDEIKQLLNDFGVTCTSESFDHLCERSLGWVAYVLFAATHIGDDGVFDRRAEALTLADLYDCCDWSVWSRLSEDMRCLLLRIAHLRTFTADQARAVSGMPNAQAVIKGLLDRGCFFVVVDNEEYTMRPFFFGYLAHKRACLLTSQEEAVCYDRTADYYCERGQLLEALRNYELAGNKERIAQLLVENSVKHPGDIDVYAFERYYLALDEEVVENSPELLAALAMIHSISLRVSDSAECVRKLEELERSLPRSDKRKKIAQERLAYLSIALPNEANASSTASRLISIASNRRAIKEVSLTGDMPGVLNGGKDLLEWSKNEQLMYRTISWAVCSVLGDYANGIPEVGLAESLFEKSSDNDFAQSILLLNKAKTKGASAKYEQLDFAANGILGRIFVCQGKLSVARKMIEQCRDDAKENGKVQLVKNVEAYLVWLDLLEGNVGSVNAWMDAEAPDEMVHFYTLERYRYLVKAKCYIVEQRYLEAICLLDRIEEYFKEYGRTYNLIEARLLRAIALYRIDDGGWRETLASAIELAEGYAFVRVVSDLGIAVLELLQELPAPGSQDYYRRLLQATQQQAALYPHYLDHAKRGDYGLTASELKVLRLLSKGLTNAEIASSLGISLSTVKTHAGSIYAKMGVKNRVAAVQFAEEEGLV